MIETCISASRRGESLPQEKNWEYNEILQEVGKSRGIAPEKAAEYGRYFAPNPDGILMDTFRLGLITKPQHKKYAVKAKIWAELEATQATMYHLIPELRVYVQLLRSMPIDKRLKSAQRLSGIDLSKMLELGKKFWRLNAQYPRAGENDAALKKYEIMQANAEQAFTLERAKVALRIKQRLAKPGTEKMLEDVLKNKGNTWHNRELNTVQKYLDAFKKFKAAGRIKPR